MRTGICSGPQTFEGVDIAGLEFIEVGVQGFLKPRDGEEIFAEQLAAARACPVPAPVANLFIPGDLKTTGPDVDLEALEAYCRTAFERAQRAGIDTIVFGSGGSRQVPEGWDAGKAFEQLAEFLTRIAPGAAERGVTLAIEPLRRQECNIICTVDEGRELVDRVGQPAIQLLADVYHMLHNDESPDAIRRAGQRLRHVHVAEKEGRTPPGVHGEDLRPFFAALKEVGYDGRVSIEGRWDDQKAQLAPAMMELRRQIETA